MQSLAKTGILLIVVVCGLYILFGRNPQPFADNLDTAPTSEVDQSQPIRTSATSPALGTINKTQQSKLYRLFFKDDPKFLSGNDYIKAFLISKNQPGSLDKELFDKLDNASEPEQLLAAFLILETSALSRSEKISLLSERESPWIAQELAAWIYRNESNDSYSAQLKNILGQMSPESRAGLLDLASAKNVGLMQAKEASHVLGAGDFAQQFFVDALSIDPGLKQFVIDKLSPESGKAYKGRYNLLETFRDHPEPNQFSLLKASLFDQSHSHRFRWYVLDYFHQYAPPQELESIVLQGVSKTADPLVENFLKISDTLPDIQAKRYQQADDLFQRIEQILTQNPSSLDPALLDKAELSLSSLDPAQKIIATEGLRQKIAPFLDSIILPIHQHSIKRLISTE